MAHRQNHGNGEGSPRVRGANKYRSRKKPIWEEEDDDD